MSSNNETVIISGDSFNPKVDIKYTKPKVNANGGKSIGILNAKANKSLYLSTPLMLTWGVNEYVDDKSGRKTYDISLQFPQEEYHTKSTKAFLKSIQDFENKIKKDAVENCKDWMNKNKMSAEVVDALFTPILKYPKDKNTGDSDYTRSPTLRIKLPVWEDEWKFELYNLDQDRIFPNDMGTSPIDLIPKASNVATVIQSGGIWFAAGKFGVTWRLVQAVVKPKQSIMGRCHIKLSEEDKQKMASQKDDDDSDVESDPEVSDSDDDESAPPSFNNSDVKEDVKAEVEEEIVKPEPVKKKIVRKKKVATSS